MPIRKSITPKPKPGYPEKEFKGYVRRFGQIYAVFYTPALQMLTGAYTKAPRQGIAGVEYLNISAVRADIEERKEKRLRVCGLEAVISNWPPAFTELKSFWWPN